MASRLHKPDLYHTSLILFMIAVIAVGVGLAIGTNGITVGHNRSSQTPFVSTPTNGGGSVSEQKGAPAQSNESQTSSPSSTEPGITKSDGGGTSMATLIAPSGDFVSNHTPGQNGAPLLETSVCNTTPGAKCQIFFTNGSKVFSLPAQTTDLGGSTYWNGWTPQSIGLTPGSWEVMATATLENQTKSTTDTRALVIAS